MQSLKRQKGMSTMGWMVAILIAGFFFTCAFKMVPAYADNRYVKESLVSLGANAGELNAMTEREIKKKLSSFFRINNVRSLSAKTAVIERKKGRTLVSFKYEVRVPLVHNVDVVMRFDNVWDSSRPGECCTPAEQP